MAKDLDYQKAIILEDRKFDKGSLGARQKKVVKEIMENLNEEGGTKQMKVKGGVKQKQTTKAKVVKTVVPPKADIKEVEAKAIELLKTLKDSVNTNGLNLELTKTKTANYCSFKVKGRIVFAIRYTIGGELQPMFAINEEQYKALGFKGEYGHGNIYWGSFWAEYPYRIGDDINKFKPIAEVALERHREKPKPKVAKGKKKK